MTMSSDERKKAAEDFKWELEDADREKFLSLAREHFPEEAVEQQPGETKAELYLRKQRVQEARELATPAAAVELYAESLKPTAKEKFVQAVGDVFKDKDGAEQRAALDKASEEAAEAVQKAKDLAAKVKRDKMFPAVRGTEQVKEQLTREEAAEAAREAERLGQAIESLKQQRR